MRQCLQSQSQKLGRLHYSNFTTFDTSHFKHHYVYTSSMRLVSRVIYSSGIIRRRRGAYRCWWAACWNKDFVHECFVAIVLVWRLFMVSWWSLCVLVDRKFCMHEFRVHLLIPPLSTPYPWSTLTGPFVPWAGTSSPEDMSHVIRGSMKLLRSPL